MRIWILDPHWEKIDPDLKIQVISLRFTEFFNKKYFSNLDLFLS